MLDARRRDGATLRIRRSRQSGVRARRRPGRAVAAGSRQAHVDRAAEVRQFWRLARAAGGRVTGEAGEGHHSDRRRSACGSGRCTAAIVCSFICVRLRRPTLPAETIVESLKRAGHPVIRIDWPDRYALGAEFFRWEFATAVAGAVLDVNPFDQPDVEATKVVTRRLAAEYEKDRQAAAGRNSLGRFRGRRLVESARGW